MNGRILVICVTVTINRDSLEEEAKKRMWIPKKNRDASRSAFGLTACRPCSPCWLRPWVSSISHDSPCSALNMAVTINYLLSRDFRMNGWDSIIFGTIGNKRTGLLRFFFQHSSHCKNLLPFTIALLFLFGVV